jgi:hypothetical protein
MKKKAKSARVEKLERRQLLAAIPTPAHVVIVIEENQTYGEVIGNSDAPYINSLAAGGALFTNSHAIGHPSQPNYLALFSGSTQGVVDDNGPLTFNAPNLASQLIAKGLTFGGYSEDLPSVGSLVLTSGEYARKHNPWSDFSNVPASDNMPFTSFPANYAQLPTVSIVVPNLIDDMHDGTVAQADTWLQQNLGAYATWAKSNNSLLIFTCDEDDGSGATNQIATFFYGANVVPGTYSENITHYSVLRTVEDMYGLTPLANAASASDISDVWQAGDTINGTTGVDRITLVQDPDHAHIDWTLNGGSVIQLAITDAAGLTINGNGMNDEIFLDYTNGDPLPNKLNLNGTFTLNNLATTGNPLANTTIDLEKSTLFLSYGAPANDPMVLIRGYLRTGYNNGLWTGTSAGGSILSSAAAANVNQTTAIGYVDSADGVITGQPLNTIELAYTLYGDTTLQAGSGHSVGFTDFMRLTQHYDIANATWDEGDFNYDGSVTSADFTLLSRTYNMTLGARAPMPAASAPTAGTATTVSDSGNSTHNAKSTIRRSRTTRKVSAL